jgi:phosphoenolpyruvate-protein phosphotransferase (PTS system enzyme I)
MRKGIAVSPGIAVGTAFCVNKIFIAPTAQPAGTVDIHAELAKYDAARRSAEEDLIVLRDRAGDQLGASGVAIFDVHRSILSDTGFLNRVQDGIIEGRLTAQASLHRALDMYSEAFSKLDDRYLRERLTDIRDVVQRIEVHLAEVHSALEEEVLSSNPVILVVDELLPSQVIGLGSLKIRGIVTQSGSETSHAAIVARSLGIPAVSGVMDILDLVKTGDSLVIDGREGLVLIAPDGETQAAYLKLEREFFDFKDHLVENRDLPAVTADGVEIELLANVNSVADAEAAVAMGATGVGLFRTEYLYLTHPTVPCEEEQVQEYVGVIQASPRHCVTIRSLDLGGDKTVPFLGRMHRESNPFMGWRSIRLCFEHPGFLNTQLRAVMRAAAVAEDLGGHVRLMFPMITTLEEICEVKKLVVDSENQLQSEGKRYARVPLGMMLEVPAAAISIDSMLDLVDFVSIGSNDLVQYLMAADRDNPKVAYLCQPLAPPVLQVLKTVIRSCLDANKSVTLCGEMAGHTLAYAVLLGMGLRSFSMSPALVPYIKEFARHLSTQTAEEILQHALTIRTTSGVQQYLLDELGKLVPDFERFKIT